MSKKHGHYRVACWSCGRAAVDCGCAGMAGFVTEYWVCGICTQTERGERLAMKKLRVPDRRREYERLAAELALELADQSWFRGAIGMIDVREPDVSIIVVKTSDMHAAVNMPVPLQFGGLPVFLRRAEDYVG